MQKNFEGIRWQVTPGILSDHEEHPSLDQVPNLGFDQVRADGSNPLRVGGSLTRMPTGDPRIPSPIIDTSYWQLQCALQDGGGDDTVPTSSGALPREIGGSAIKQQFGLTGFGHEGAYRDSDTARIVALYAIQKIAGTAKVPA